MKISEVTYSGPYGDYEDTKREYAHGACWAFALALHELFGVDVGWVTKGGIPIHGFAIMPDGSLQDVNGRNSLQDIQKKYKADSFAIKVTPDQMANIASVDDSEIDDAKEFISFLK